MASWIHDEHKNKLLAFVLFAALYFLFHYLPLEEWMGEVPYLILKISFYGVMGVALIILKKRIHIHIQNPNRQIKLIWVLPLILFCFVDFIYVWAFKNYELLHLEPWILALDIVADLFLSIVEDILFVDLGIELYSLRFAEKDANHKYLQSILSVALLFTLAHCFTFLRYPLDQSIVILISVFYLIVECGYLAVYFHSPLIPIFAHCLFNEMNFVVFNAIFHIEINDSYTIFTVLVFLLSSCYLAAIYRLSTLQERYVDLQEQMERVD